MVNLSSTQVEHFGIKVVAHRLLQGETCAQTLKHHLEEETSASCDR